MKNDCFELCVMSNKTILSSDCIFYKTERFIKQTRYITNIDILVSKLCETLLYNFDEFDKINISKNDIFLIKTDDGLFSFEIKFGKQLELNLNKKDIILVDCINSEVIKQANLRIDEYLKNKIDFKIRVEKEIKDILDSDFNKLYLVSNASGVNLPKLNKIQKTIVETVDKNILVQGVAGSGKTNVCIDKIIFTACKNFSGKTLYTTFSRGLLIDTKLKVELFKKDLEQILNVYKTRNIVFLDDNHKKALENRLGIYFFSDDDDRIFEKIGKIIYYLTNKVDYLLIEDIYKGKFGDARFVNEQYFLNRYCNNFKNHQIEKCFYKLSKYSKEIIYKEIYGMIFGFYDATNPEEIMSLEDYIEKRKNSFSRFECENIYQIAIDYQKHCKINNLIDNNSGSRLIMKEFKSDFEYSLSILDEVQDYTQVNLNLFKKLSLKLFCVGDALQMINPSYFSFGYLKNLLYEKDLTDVLELKSNYRNSAEIANVINSLGEINKSEFGTHNFVLKGESVDNGLQSNIVYVSSDDFIQKIAKSNFENFTFITATKTEKDDLKKIIKNQEVLTVNEIKGLERNTVVSFNILSSNKEKWKLLENNKINHKKADENSVFRYYYNLFYVAMSRAKQNIFVLETEEINQFKNFFLNNFEQKNVQSAIETLTQIVSKSEFTQREFIERVEEFIKLEQFDNARFAANKIKDDIKRINAIRSIEIYEKFIKIGKYRDAGIRFWECGLIEKAKEMFLLSQDEILIELIDICSNKSNKDLNIDIVNYFEDVKDNKIAQEFIVEMVKKDLVNLKSSFKEIKENLQKGRK